jgi:VIT1/CCC1 family predicted Fe2+/Mn2+ transporter
MARASLLKPAIFGLADGCMSLIGVTLYLLGDQRIIFWAALSGAISSAVSMGAGEFMSDSDNGLWPSVVMGACTGLGGLVPAIPFLFTHGTLALVLMGVICLLIGTAVGVMRARTCKRHTFRQELLGTYFIFLVIFGVVIGCAMGFPSPG